MTKQRQLPHGARNRARQLTVVQVPAKRNIKTTIQTTTKPSNHKNGQRKPQTTRKSYKLVTLLPEQLNPVPVQGSFDWKRGQIDVLQPNNA
jgi:hypothetical protein